MFDARYFVLAGFITVAWAMFTKACGSVER